MSVVKLLSLSELSFFICKMEIIVPASSDYCANSMRESVKNTQHSTWHLVNAQDVGAAAITLTGIVIRLLAGTCLEGTES